MTSLWRRIGLVFETALFTVLVPGTVAFWLPRMILDPAQLSLPSALSVTRALALIPLALGTVIYLRCLWEFAARGRGIPAPVDHPKELVVSGLYRYVRNPMYLGMLIFLIGEAVFFQSRGLFLYTLAWLTVVHLVVLLYEEPNLHQRFGSSYDRYAAAVNRWIPGRRYDG